MRRILEGLAACGMMVPVGGCRWVGVVVDGFRRQKCNCTSMLLPLCFWFWFLVCVVSLAKAGGRPDSAQTLSDEACTVYDTTS